MRARGFTLIELAIVMIIMGIMMTGFLQYYKVQMKRQIWLKTQENMATVQLAIDRFVAHNQRLPCPAQSIYDTSDTGFGRETDCDTVTLQGVVDATGVADRVVRIGTVPARSLGIADSYAQDGWGRSFTFAVTRALATQTGWSTGNPYNNSAIRLVDEKDEDILDPPATYVLVSHGGNGAGVVTPTGDISGCLLATREGENCNNDDVFRRAPYSQAVGPAYFDDIVVDNQGVPDAGTVRLSKKMENLLTCQQRGAFFKPSSSYADGDGCISASISSGQCAAGLAMGGVDSRGQIVCVPMTRPGMCRGGRILLGYDENGDMVCDDLVQKMLSCAQQGLLYAAQGAPHATENGCVTAKASPSKPNEP